MDLPRSVPARGQLSPAVATARPAAIDCGFGHACTFCKLEDSCGLDKPAHNRRLIEDRLQAIGGVILVLANKGGVGKSTVAANLAASLAAQGHRTALADADIHGPNAAQFFGLQGEHTAVTDRGIRPRRYRFTTTGQELPIGSLGFFLDGPDVPVVWRDAYKFDYVHHLIGSYDWGTLDFLVIDMPPGTGNELITICDLLEGIETRALLVTAPQAVALLDTLKAARFCRERGLPVAGVVENMAGMTCPHCEGHIEMFPRDPLAERLAENGIETLARLPFSPALAFASDAGRPAADDGDLQGDEAGRFAVLASRMVAAFAGEQSAAMSGELVESLGVDAQTEAIEAALAEQPGIDQAAVRTEIQALIDGEVERLGRD